MGFLSKIKNNMRKMPRRPGMISDMRFRGEMPRGGGFGNLGEAIRRLKEQRGGDMGMPRMDFGDQIGYTRPNKDPSMPIAFDDPSFRMIGKPQPIPERMPTDPSSYYNPTIFGQQMGNMDFSQMPEISPIDMSNLQMPTLPREISQMDIPQMPEGLPSMEDVQGGRDLQQDFPTQRRMMMAEGDEVFMDSSPEQQAFSIETEIKNLMNEYEMAVRNNEMDRAEILNQEINRMEAYKIKMLANDLEKSDDELERDLYRDTLLSYPGYDRGMEGNRRGLDKYGNRLNIMEDRPYQVRSEQNNIKYFTELAGRDDFLESARKYRRPEFDRIPELAGGGYVNGYAEGDEVMMMQGNEIESMLSGMDSEESGAMDELEQMAPEMEMIDQLVMMVAQMIQQGAGEEEVIGFLREQGLDDEDIGTVLQLVTEMSETEEMAEDQIGNELAQLG
jgi:hypothetical protein